MKKPLLTCLATALITVCAALPATSFATGYTQTKYPILLVHGLFGFNNIGPVEYFYGIPSALRSGGAKVYVSSVSAANSTEVRGEQLYLEIKRTLALTGAAKINLIGHSHGGPTIRYVAARWPNLIASATSVGGVNKGTVIADILVGASAGSLSSAIIKSIGNGLGTIISFLSGSPTLPQNALAAAQSLSTAGSLKFNASYPQGIPTTACGEGAYQVNGVSYFSWSGGSSYTNVFDVLDPALALTSLAFSGAKNDGLVASCSSHLGKVIRDDYGMNHADEINQTVGIVNLFETNPTTIYRAHANRLVNLGL